MRWEKLGLVFDLSKNKPSWVKSHAMLPTSLLVEDLIRVYFTGRDFEGHSNVGFVDLDRKNPQKIIYVHDRPLFEIGEPGLFDDSGILGTCAVRVGSTIHLYYNGYNRRILVPWSNAIGLAKSYDNGVTFEKVSAAPIVDRSHLDPYFVISPGMLFEDGIWHIWYTSGIGWKKVQDRVEPLYVVKYANSLDGIVWNRTGIVSVPQSTPDEATAKATVIKHNGEYKMWFIYRGSQDFRDGVDSYRIGYAKSSTPYKWDEWDRDDTKAGISCGSAGEWDEKMLAYPSVIEADGNVYMFYNGNGFGANGFGCAVLRE